MILRIKQTSRLPVRKHEIRFLNNKVFCTGGVQSVFESYLNCENNYYEIKTDEISKTVITRNGVQIGLISQDIFITKKVLFLPIGYEYYKMSFENESFQIFESGLGAGKHFFTIYKNDSIVAVIHKDDKVINHLNTYTAYCEKNEGVLMMLIFAMFLESTAFCDRTGGIGNTVVDSPYYSTQKELRERYDPTFIERVKKLDGIIE